MVITNHQDLQGIMAIGRICGMALQYLVSQVEVGMSAADLDAMGADFLKRHHARSAPILTYRFPGHICVSINDEAAHGIPHADKIIQAGDLVNIDVSAEKDGYWADCGMSICVPPIAPTHQKMLDVTRQAFEVGYETAKAGVYVYDVGRAIERHVIRNGFQILDQLAGHGVGRGIHEAPTIPNWYNRTIRQRLQENAVVTIEPFISTRTRVVMTMPDGWTLKTSDGSLATQYEHTVIITKDKPILVTAVE